ncbi:xanthine dehydrogenase accessory factor [Micromonospora pattaloongensis]|uniref:Xanthine dehydrogenase accessory factor n=2 Tax=Micromonospora pattaloongensis TaxID=405436 RepID=A0A1H3R4S7_9ACTN|nr:XdhC/CoxI family protein [Micromonospora pattaloongensis]SDZ20218.1 xanthine dehydrogenase accessory factor [Micromonospora pattaloongensis]
MREIAGELRRWRKAGQAVAVATVVETWHSAPKPAGSSMLVGPDGTAVGSISGGCVEGAVYQLSQDVLVSGVPVLRRYGISDTDAFEVGLTCGGTLDVFVQRIDHVSFPELDEVLASIADGEPVAVVTCVHAESTPTGRRLIVWPDRTAGSLGSTRLDDTATDDTRALLAADRSAMLRYGHDGQPGGDELSLFVDCYAAPPRLIVFGAIDFAAALARVGSFLGYRVTLCDARPVFATERRFPDADEVVVAWPHRYLATQAQAGQLDERTVVCVLTHDPKFDVPVLQVALRIPLAYVGAMGSRRTHDHRMARLREAGLTEAELARLASPIGLDLGARTSEETAVSIAAEIIANRRGGSGSRLSLRSGRIHRENPA